MRTREKYALERWLHGETARRVPRTGPATRNQRCGNWQKWRTS